MFRIALCILVSAGLSVAAQRSVVKVLSPDTTKVLKVDTLKTTKGDTATTTVISKMELNGIVDTLVITTDTTKIRGKKVSAVVVKPAAVAPAWVAPAAKPVVAPKK